MVEIQNLSKTYPSGDDNIRVLNQINLSIASGEFVALTGKSGSGKSTLLNAMGILDRYDSGEYWLNGQLVKHLTRSEEATFRNRHIGFIFQSFQLISFKTAFDNVMLPLFYRKMNKKEAEKRALAILDRVELGDRVHHYPNQLSGGQKQRVAIARALVNEPELILADEPTGALDTQTSTEVFNLLKEINKEGKTIVLVTHEPELANQCQRKILLKDGQIN